MIIPNIWGKKHVPNHQPEMVYTCIYLLKLVHSGTNHLVWLVVLNMFQPPTRLAMNGHWTLSNYQLPITLLTIYFYMLTHQPPIETPRVWPPSPTAAPRGTSAAGTNGSRPRPSPGAPLRRQGVPWGGKRSPWNTGENIRFNWILLDFAGFYWILLDLTGFKLILLDLSWFNWI